MIGTRHRPASHPVHVRERFRADLRLAMEMADPRDIAMSATAMHDQASRIEDLAHRVVMLPDTPLTGQQRRSLHILARELLRRANSPYRLERS